MKMELLSPAGDVTSFKQAIDKGADAVYFGLQNFNARRNADNFNDENVDKWVKYAHLFGVKAYVTLNINVKDSEKDELIKVILACKNAKIDAFIVTDMMTACLVRKYTDIPMHASTQMGVSNLYGAKYLENLGFTRVVLARETLEKDIIDIKKHTNLEIEYFVHGALCVCYSGQCLFSSIISGESGNRGLCKQPCRQLYQSEKESGYLLSTKDLCLIDKIEKLNSLGIDSLKIEGRLKRPEYVGVVAKNYRKAIDEFYLNCSFKNDKRISELKKVYNRGGYTRGYLFNDDVTYKKVQNHIGEKVGEIVRLNGKYSVLKGKFDKESGYKIFRNGEEICGGKFNLVKNLGGGEFLIDYFGKIGDEFNVTTDANQLNDISQYSRKLNANIEIKANVGDYLYITASCNDIGINIQSTDKILKAENKPITKEDVVKIFNKVGDTVFNPNIIASIDNDAFYPLSKINNLRKETYVYLENKIIENYESNLYNKYKENTNSIETNILEYFNLQNNENVEQCIIKNGELDNTSKTGQNHKRLVAVETDSAEIGKDTLKNIDLLVVNPFYLIGDDIIETYFKLIKTNNLKTEIYLKLPTIARGSDITVIENILDKYSKKLDGLYFNTIYGFELARKYKLKAFGGLGQNLYNSIAINNKEFTYEVLSAELNKDEIKKLSNQNTFVYAFGKLPLMTFAHCVNKNVNNVNCNTCNKLPNVRETYIKDKKYEFTIKRNKVNSCYFTLYNSFTTNILDYCNKYNLNIYIDMVQYTGSIGSTLDLLFKGGEPCENYTKGHLNRGVK